jgi:hypothetical protein
LAAVDICAEMSVKREQHMAFRHSSSSGINSS